MKIGNLQIDNNLFLAPMAGVTDLPFRVLCKEQGCGLVYTEMVSAKALSFKNKNADILLATDKREGTVVAQLFGSEPTIMRDMALEVEKKGFKMIDINMGCPVPKIVNNKEGSALMKNPKLVGEIVKEVSSALSVPLTIKIRKGFYEENINAVEIAKIAEENGAAAVGVHGRTREQYYSGEADWDIIRKVKKSVSIPVIGNGDIFEPEDAKNMIDYTNCDAIMIGRGVKGNPWIFSRTKTYLETGIVPEKPSFEEIIETIIRHAKMLVEYKGEYIAVREMRKHVSWYTKGLYNTAQLRREINETETFEQLYDVLYRFQNLVLNDPE